MDHLKKAIIEQISILSDHQGHESDLCFQFIRTHAMSIVQLSDEAMFTAPGRFEAEYHA